MAQLYLPRNNIKWEFYILSNNFPHFCKIMCTYFITLQENLDLTKFEITSSKQSHKSFSSAI